LLPSWPLWTELKDDRRITAVEDSDGPDAAFNKNTDNKFYKLVILSMVQTIMKLGYLSSIPIAGISMILISLAMGGCGGSSPTGDVNHLTYDQVLHGLKGAALSDEPYKKTIRQAEDLNRVQIAVVHAFCNFAWEVWINREGYKLADHAYVVGRVRDPIRYKIYGHGGAVREAVDELRKAFDLESLTESLLRRYSRACYH
jgi:hypothetical protein